MQDNVRAMALCSEVWEFQVEATVRFAVILVLVPRRREHAPAEVERRPRKCRCTGLFLDPGCTNAMHYWILVVLTNLAP